MVAVDEVACRFLAVNIVEGGMEASGFGLVGFEEPTSLLAGRVVTDLALIATIPGVGDMGDD